MNTASRKAKGRNLQKWVCQQILSAFPSLTKDDVRSTSMGAGGADVQLSAAAKKLFPYSVESKNQEVSKTVYDWYQQACDQEDGGEPLLIIKRNREKPLAVVSADHFMKVLIHARSADNQ